MRANKVCREIEKLQAQLPQLMKAGKFLEWQAAKKRLDALIESCYEVKTTTLREAIKPYGDKARKEVTATLLEAIVTADILNKYMMELQEHCRKYGFGVPVLEELKGITQRLNKIVGQIDEASRNIRPQKDKNGNSVSFSDKYSEVVDMVETKFYGLENIVNNIVSKEFDFS